MLDVGEQRVLPLLSLVSDARDVLVESLGVHLWRSHIPEALLPVLHDLLEIKENALLGLAGLRDVQMLSQVLQLVRRRLARLSCTLQLLSQSGAWRRHHGRCQVNAMAPVMQVHGRCTLFEIRPDRQRVLVLDLHGAAAIVKALLCSNVAELISNRRRPVLAVLATEEVIGLLVSILMLCSHNPTGDLRQEDRALRRLAKSLQLVLVPSYISVQRAQHHLNLVHPAIAVALVVSLAVPLAGIRLHVLAGATQDRLAQAVLIRVYLLEEFARLISLRNGS